MIRHHENPGFHLMWIPFQMDVSDMLFQRIFVCNPLALCWSVVFSGAEAVMTQVRHHKWAGGQTEPRASPKQSHADLYNSDQLTWTLSTHVDESDFIDSD